MENYITVNLHIDLINKLRKAGIIPKSKNWREKGETPVYTSIHNYFHALASADLQNRNKSKLKRG